MSKAVSVVSRWASSRPVRLGVFSLVALGLAWPWLNMADHHNLFRDEQYLFAYERNAAATVLDYGEVPLWDPYYCGGVYALASPQSRFASPAFLLTLAFGAQRAQALLMFLLLLAGMEGFWLFARDHRGSAVGAALAAPAFVANGYFATGPMRGWYHFLGFCIVPLVLHLVHRGVRGHRASQAWAALLLASLVGFGGTYAAPMAAILCAFEVALAMGSRPPQRAAIVRAAGTIAVVSLGLSAVRVLPLLDLLAVAKPVFGGMHGYRVKHILEATLMRPVLDGGTVQSHVGQFDMAGYFLPVTLATLFLRRAWRLVPVTAYCVWFALGDWVVPSLFELQGLLPVVGNLRHPERYLLMFHMLALALTTLGMRNLEARMRTTSTWPMLLWVLAAVSLLASVATLAPMHAEAAKHRFTVAPPAPSVQTSGFKQARGTRWGASYFQPLNRGTLSCFEDYAVPMSHNLRADLPAEEFVVAGKGTVRRLAWSPNRIVLQVELREPGTVMVNQNHHPGWRGNVGKVLSADGRLAVALPAGSHRLELNFWPRSFVVGAVVSGLMFLLWLGLFFSHKSFFPPWAYGLPLVAGAIAFAATPEAAWTQPAPRAPNGEPLVVKELPTEATAVNASFAGGKIKLHAWGGSHTDEGSYAFELWWSKNDLPVGVVVLVLATSPGEEPIRVNHDRLSALERFDSLPDGVLLRDRFTLPLTPKQALKTWKVQVGLALDGRAVLVQSPGSLERGDDELLRLTELPVWNP